MQCASDVASTSMCRSRRASASLFSSLKTGRYFPFLCIELFPFTQRRRFARPALWHGN
jgi:hypothetical protein